MQSTFPAKILERIGSPAQDFHMPGCLVLSTFANGVSEVVLDYGRAAGGMPFFETSQVNSNTGPVSIDVIYSETCAGVEKENGDGPFFLFSNAMDTYRLNTHTFEPSTDTQRVESRFAQKSQRYQKIVLKTPNASIHFSTVGLRQMKAQLPCKSSFKCSNEKLNKIWSTGVATIEMCTVEAGETAEAWEVTESGTKIIGQHWAPCRQGTRWSDLSATFEVKIDSAGASWGIHMVANGLIFCLDVQKKSLAAFEGLSDSGGVFPTTPRGSWQIPPDINLEDWLQVKTTARGACVDVEINGQVIASLIDLNIHPILGGSANNTGSIAFGGPAHYVALYRSLIVKDLQGQTLYENGFLPANKARTMADFAVGTNELACTIDGAKRDRACFGGDLFVMGRSIYYSTGFLEAVLGSITLLSSHQTSQGYIGNLCPIQAPVHSGSEEPPTYAFYSLSYSLALIVGIKDYMMYSGDLVVVKRLWEQLEKLIAFTTSFLDGRGLVVAPPPLSMDWLPMGGPHFGASAKINLAFYDALTAMGQMGRIIGHKRDFDFRAGQVRDNILKHLWNEKTGILRMSDTTAPAGICQDAQAYGLSTGVIPPHGDAMRVLAAPSDSESLPPAYQNIEKWDAMRVVSPYASGFAAEALFARNQGEAAITLIERVWGKMVDPTNTNYSGGHWEAMTPDGLPVHDDTSLMHGWSTWPIFLLPQYLAGLQPLEPGWVRWKMEPVLAGLESVEVELSTPAGNITASVRMSESAGRGVIIVKIPKGTIAEICAPQGWTMVNIGKDHENAYSQKLVMNGREDEVKLTVVKISQAKSSPQPPAVANITRKTKGRSWLHETKKHLTRLVGW